MTASVSIRVDERDRALQIPLPAVMEREGRYFCVVTAEDGLAAREVVLGPSNDSMAVVEDGLADGEQVILGPEVLEEELDFPAAEPVLTVDKPEAKARTADLVATPSRRSA